MTFTVVPVPGSGPEDVVVGTRGRDEGAVFTGTEDGSILRVSHDGQRIDRVAHTGGRPLGIELDPDGGLLVCDAHRVPALEVIGLGANGKPEAGKTYTVSKKLRLTGTAP